MRAHPKLKNMPATYSVLYEEAADSAIHGRTMTFKGLAC